LFLKKVIILEQASDGVRARALSLFAARAKRTIGIPGEVNVLITGSHELQELNLRFRRAKKPTDVLSFPSGSGQAAGDIAISAEIAAVSAAQLGHSTETELKILILHGLLHLAGYDHESDRGEMHSIETSLRREFGLPDGLIERTHDGRLASTKPAGQSGCQNSTARPRRPGLNHNGRGCL
jgi:probable rRNA maturation factor